MVKALFALALLLSTISSSIAQNPNPYSGYAELPACKSASNARPPSQAWYCTGQLRALAYVSQALSDDLRSCVPNNLTDGQLTLVVIHYMEARPQHLHEDFLALALQAFRDAWPCR